VHDTRMFEELHLFLGQFINFWTKPTEKLQKLSPPHSEDLNSSRSHGAINIRFLPHRQGTLSPLERPITDCFQGKTDCCLVSFLIDQTFLFAHRFQLHLSCTGFQI